jgi:hypothetical protein
MLRQPHYRVHLFEFGQPLAGDAARETTARLLDSPFVERAAVRLLMHYGDKDPLPGFAPVKFAGGKNGFRLVGFGNAGIGLIRSLAPQIALAWSHHARQPVRQRAWDGICAIERKPFEIQLMARKLVIHKRQTQRERFEADPIAHVEGVISRSLERQRAVLGIEQEVPAVRVVDWQGEFSARLGKGTVAFRGVKDVRFTLTAQLTGLWSLGYLSSNGYGLCDANMCNAETVARKLEEALDAVGQ